ncbi:MAG TPA: glycosyltransferase family 4 protein [Coleofasciculaceae cyanobacterium]
MKIAVIGCKGLPAKQGGIEHHCQEIYSRMIEQGHSVDLFARSSYITNQVFPRRKIAGINVISLPCLKVKGMDALLSSALGAIASSGRRYDIVHFHALGPALFTWLPKLATTSKIVVTCHGLDWRRSKWSKASSQIIRLGEQTAVGFADAMIVVSHELQSYFQQTYDRETIYITNAPSKLEEPDPNFSYGHSLGLQPKRYILFLGRLVPEKCPDLLIKAFQNLQPEGWKLVLVGGSSDTGNYTSQLFDQVTGNPKVVFTGELSGSRLAEIVHQAGLFVLPSEIEGLPLALLEAMQEGIPVMASNLPVHQELLGQDRGLLFSVGDVKSCEHRLDWAIRHPQELIVMAKNAQQYVRREHNWDTITAETLNLYKEIVREEPTQVSSSQNHLKHMRRVQESIATSPIAIWRKP